MNKLSKKLSSRICLGIMIIFCISFLLNNYLLYKYYLYEQKINLYNASQELQSMEIKNIINNTENYRARI